MKDFRFGGFCKVSILDYGFGKDFERMLARCWKDVGLLKDLGRTLDLERFERILDYGFWKDFGRSLVRC